MSKKKAFWFLVGCAVLWSTGGFLIKSVNMQPLAISGARSLIAAVFLVLVRGKPRFSSKPVFTGAALAYAGTLTAFVLATRLTTAADAVLLQYTAPVFVLVFGYLFLRERVTRVDALVTFLVIAGLVIFFLESLGKSTALSTAPLGNALGVLSGVFFALQAVLLRRSSNEGLSTESVIVFGNLICTLIALPVLLQSRPTLLDLVWLLLAGVFQVGLSYVLYMKVLPHVTSLELILVPVIEPILNPVMVFFLRGEKPGLTTILGGIFILSVVTLWCLYRARSQGIPLDTAIEDAAPARAKPPAEEQDRQLK